MLTSPKLKEFWISVIIMSIFLALIPQPFPKNTQKKVCFVCKSLKMLILYNNQQFSFTN